MFCYSSPPMYSFGEAHRDDELKTMSYYYTPGPGQYDRVDDNKTKTAYPAWKMVTSTRPHLYTSSNPGVGPGSYEDPLQKEPSKHAKKTFAKAKRGQSEMKGVTTVGPGSYNPKKFAKAPPNFSFGYKTDPHHTTDRALTPGPGAYDIADPFAQYAKGNQSQREGDPKTAFLRTAPQNITRSNDLEYRDFSQPGPGEHYNPNSENYKFRYFTPTYSFGTSTRDELYNDERKHVPGPGKYDFAGGIKTKSGFTILGRHPTKGNSSDTPAPNVYNQNIQPLRQTAPHFSIGRSERTNLAMGSPDIPGPGNYYTGDQNSLKGAKIGTSTRPPLHSQEGKKLPGPGEYNVRGEIGKNAKYSMGVKTQPKKMSEVMPGPGEYEPFGSIYLEKNNGAIIGTSERPPLYKKGSAPGPGQYDVRGNIGGGHKSKIGKAARVGMAKVNDEPGPGFYNIPSAIGNVQKYLLPEFAKEKRRKQAEKEISFRGIFG